MATTTAATSNIGTTIEAKMSLKLVVANTNYRGFVLNGRLTHEKRLKAEAKIDAFWLSKIDAAETWEDKVKVIAEERARCGG
jgi:hypothetical protein